MRRKVINVASIDFEIVLWARPTIRRESDASGRIAVINIRLIVASAVKRKDECLALVAEKPALHEKGGQIGLKFSNGQPRTDRNVDGGLRARWQSFGATTDLMDFACIASGGECAKSSQRFRRETWLMGIS